MYRFNMNPAVLTGRFKPHSGKWGLTKSSGAHLVTFDRALAKFGKGFNLQVELLKP